MQAIIISEVRQKEDEAIRSKKERREAQRQRELRREAELLQTKEDARKRDQERMEQMIAEQAKIAKPGHRLNLKPLDFGFDQVIEKPMRSRASEEEEDEDEIPDFMEPPQPSHLLTHKQLQQLKKKYERYLARKEEDLILQGPVLRADCEDLVCTSCKLTVEEYGTIPSLLPPG